MKKSHIIPEFLYKPLYDVKHQYIVISTDKRISNRCLQKGVREKLLCHECEQKRQKWETYVANLWRLGPRAIEDYDNAVLWKNVDYRKFKLFQLSLIWLSSICEHKAFREINLGQPHEEILRYMIYNEIPGEYYDYGCMIIYSPEYTELSKQSILADILVPFEPFKRFLLILQGWFWIYPISDGDEAFPFRACFLQTDGTLPILKEDRMHEDWLSNYIQELRNKGKLEDIQ